jgi:hypothetical protein
MDDTIVAVAANAAATLLLQAEQTTVVQGVLVKITG